MSVVDRTRPPASGPIRHFDFPDVERVRLAGGFDLLAARMSRLPMVSLDVFMRGGEHELAPGRAGLAVLTAEAVDGGTRRRSGTELAEALERLGARLTARAGWEGTTFSLSCLADRLEEALPLLAETLAEADFPAAEVERAREQRLASLRQRRMDPAMLASDTASRAYYAADVPYARPVGGTTSSVATMGRDTLLGYADAAYRPVGGGVAVAGDVDAAEVAALVERHLGTWRGAPPAGPAFEARPATRTRRVVVVDRPGSVQSEVRVGHVGVERTATDYFPLTIANLLFGGAFTSRLNLNLRERNGFTYGVRSRFWFRTRPGPFEVSTAVGGDVTAAAVGEILAEMERLVAEGPTPEEVRGTTDFAAGVFGLQLETVDQVASRLSQLVVYGLPDRYFHEYRDRIRAVGVEEVTAAVRDRLRPHEAQIVVVGDADAVAGPLESLEIGPVDVVSPDG